MFDDRNPYRDDPRRFPVRAFAFGVFLAVLGLGLVVTTLARAEGYAGANHPPNAWFATVDVKAPGHGGPSFYHAKPFKAKAACVQWLKSKEWLKFFEGFTESEITGHQGYAKIGVPYCIQFKDMRPYPVVPDAPDEPAHEDL